MFVYLGLSVASHVTFDVLDVWGQTCIDNAANPAIPKATKLTVGEERTIPFDISRLCTATGVQLETNGARYYIKVDPPTASGATAAFPIPVGGFSTKPYELASWYKRMYLTLFIPLRRELFEDWFRIVLRYGRTGAMTVNHAGHAACLRGTAAGGFVGTHDTTPALNDYAFFGPGHFGRQSNLELDG